MRYISFLGCGNTNRNLFDWRVVHWYGVFGNDYAIDVTYDLCVKRLYHVRSRGYALRNGVIDRGNSTLNVFRGGLTYKLCLLVWGKSNRKICDWGFIHRHDVLGRENASRNLFDRGVERWNGFLGRG